MCVRGESMLVLSGWDRSIEGKRKERVVGEEIYQMGRN